MTPQAHSDHVHHLRQHDFSSHKFCSGETLAVRFSPSYKHREHQYKQFRIQRQRSHPARSEISRTTRPERILAMVTRLRESPLQHQQLVSNNENGDANFQGYDDEFIEPVPSVDVPGIPLQRQSLGVLGTEDDWYSENDESDEDAILATNGYDDRDEPIVLKAKEVVITRPGRPRLLVGSHSKQVVAATHVASILSKKANEAPAGAIRHVEKYNSVSFGSENPEEDGLLRENCGPIVSHFISETYPAPTVGWQRGANVYSGASHQQAAVPPTRNFSRNLPARARTHSGGFAEIDDDRYLKKTNGCWQTLLKPNRPIPESGFDDQTGTPIVEDEHGFSGNSNLLPPPLHSSQQNEITHKEDPVDQRELGSDINKPSAPESFCVHETVPLHHHSKYDLLRYLENIMMATTRSARIKFKNLRDPVLPKFTAEVVQQLRDSRLYLKEILESNVSPESTLNRGWLARPFNNSNNPSDVSSSTEETCLYVPREVRSNSEQYKDTLTASKSGRPLPFEASSDTSEQDRDSNKMPSNSSDDNATYELLLRIFPPKYVHLLKIIRGLCTADYVIKNLKTILNKDYDDLVHRELLPPHNELVSHRVPDKAAEVLGIAPREAASIVQSDSSPSLAQSPAHRRPRRARPLSTNSILIFGTQGLSNNMPEASEISASELLEDGFEGRLLSIAVLDIINQRINKLADRCEAMTMEIIGSVWAGRHNRAARQSLRKTVITILQQNDGFSKP